MHTGIPQEEAQVGASQHQIPEPQAELSGTENVFVTRLKELQGQTQSSLEFSVPKPA